ncbi:MAG: O-antigen ligase family protein [Candidatus Eremiobacteraeota bacterium]|nr:O-antigen ligase family protein [Candidatus Eremiobacteraeota bacterium]
MSERGAASSARPSRSLVAAGPFAAAALGPLLPLLIVFAGTLPPTAPHVNRTFAIGLACLTGLAVACSMCGLLVVGVRRFPRKLFAPLAALVASQFIALVFAIDPKAGMFGVGCTLAGIVVMLAAVETLGDAGVRRTFLACYFISAIGATVFAAVISLMKLPPAMFAYEHGRASGTFLQPNELAGYLLFVIPLGCAQIAAPRWLRSLGLVAAATGTAGLLLSVSRAAMVSLAAGCTVFVRRLGPRALVAYLLVALLALGALVTVFRNVAHDPSENASRIAVWEGSLRMAQRFALTGVGPYNFHLVYPSFRPPSTDVDELHAHDLPLHILIEDGILGLACLTWFVVAAVGQAARIGRSIPSDDRERSLLFWALAAAFGATALQNIVDVVTTFLLVVSWPMLGLLLSLEQGGT